MSGEVRFAMKDEPVVQIRISQPGHYLHFGPVHSLWHRTILCIVGCLTILLTSTY